MYWNRDKRDEPSQGWHDECFPVRRPFWFEVQGHESAESYVDATFGGAEHRAELERTDEWYAERIAHHRELAVTPFTPRGYAWAPWQYGGPCAACGRHV